MDAFAPADGEIEMQVYRLYVSTASPLSARATVNARRFLNKHLPERHQLSVLDIRATVAQAKADQVIASPTLVRMLPLPQRRFIGDMSDTERLRVALGLPAETGAS
ncbi:circadian clock protein KaiB [Diaphorobacter aerolatus]|uniref:Circadian clock protein KaiB n=1 Tax=Diaphorobacter aerolatus TaxID=1288495 RepID=A0A7H0GG35_9BURK|nr:circadian clock protein KaiB [Diaphorobacter aerolatus]